MRSLCVFCGSSPGHRQEYLAACDSLAAGLLERDLTLVYGGAHKGLMGRIADQVMDGGGRVIGVIPEALRDKEIAHDGLTELHVVASMHERKALMAELADGFVALPGGFGTLEEIIEALTWGQLSIHSKPCGLLNIEGYYEALLSFVRHAVAEGFLRQRHADMLLVADNVASLLEQFSAYEAPVLAKWRD